MAFSGLKARPAMAEPRNPRERNAKPVATEPDRHGPAMAPAARGVAGIVIAAWFAWHLVDEGSIPGWLTIVCLPAGVIFTAGAIETEHGWLVVYHCVRQTVAGGLYRAGLALQDLDHRRTEPESADRVATSGR
jgi:hypothetical protein